LWFHEVQVRVVLTLIGIGIAATSLSLALRLAHRALLAVVLAMNEKKNTKNPPPSAPPPPFSPFAGQPSGYVFFFVFYFCGAASIPPLAPSSINERRL